MDSDNNFSFIYWNIWAESQLNEVRRSKLKQRLSEIIDTYQPDLLGISEVLRNRHVSAPVLDFLEELGYHTYYTHFYMTQDGLREFGTAIASRVPPLDIKEYKLSPYKLSRYLCVATMALKPGKNFKVGIVHPLPIGARDLREHTRQIKTLRKHMANLPIDILGADLNEFAWLTNIWQKKLPVKRLTGSYLHPTWTWGSHRYTPIRANLDSILWAKSSPLTLREFSILDRQPSDHAPLLGRFIIK